MNSFIGISNAHTTNLAVVAPGIAQALLATALGLVAAIPAVMIYNVLARQTTHYRALLRRRLGADHGAGQPRSRPRQAAARASRRVTAVAIRLDHGSDELTEVHDINVMPFIDVMLVLLIIFMVAAPLATVDVPVDLPSSNAQPQQRPDKPIYLTIKADLTLAIGDDPVAPGALTATLDARQRRQQGGPHLPARRPRRALWRRHAGDERSALPPAISRSRWSRWKRGTRNDRARAHLVRGRGSARPSCAGPSPPPSWSCLHARADRRLFCLWQPQSDDDSAAMRLPAIAIELTPCRKPSSRSRPRSTPRSRRRTRRPSVTLPEEKPPEKVAADQSVAAHRRRASRPPRRTSIRRGRR